MPPAPDGLRSPPHSLPAADSASAHVEALAHRGAERHYRRGTLIIQEGDRGDTLYIVRSGRLRAFIASDDFRAVERAERQRLMRQEAAMTELVTVLDERVAAFQAAAPQEGDFPLGKACDLSGDGTCEACQ